MQSLSWFFPTGDDYLIEFLPLKIYLFILLCVCVPECTYLCVCACMRTRMHHMHVVTAKARWGLWVPWHCSYSCQPLCVCWDLNSGVSRWATPPALSYWATSPNLDTESPLQPWTPSHPSSPGHWALLQPSAEFLKLPTRVLESCHQNKTKHVCEKLLYIHVIFLVDSHYGTNFIILFVTSNS